MSVNDCDHDLLHSYLDGELPVSECEGLWRRLAVERDLAAELDRMRADAALRRAVWPSYEPDDVATTRLEECILRGARRQSVLAIVRRGGTIATSAAAVMLLGFTVGWFGHDRFQLSHNDSSNGGLSFVQASAPAESNPDASPFVVSVRDDSGRVVAVQHFKSLSEARQFADDVTRAQASRPESHDSNIVPAVAKF